MRIKFTCTGESEYRAVAAVVAFTCAEVFVDELEGVLHVYARMQEARLQVLMQLLKQREEQHNDLNMKRLDRLWSVVGM